MSGHSKWSTIKRKKGAIDSERSKVFQKLAKELYVAAKSGDPNPENNPSLRMVVEKAKSENMPKANIESAINKAKNQGVGENYEQMLDDILIDANSGKFDNAPIEPTAKADPFKDIINQCFTRDSNGFLVQKEDWKN